MHFRSQKIILVPASFLALSFALVINGCDDPAEVSEEDLRVETIDDEGGPQPSDVQGNELDRAAAPRGAAGDWDGHGGWKKDDDHGGWKKDDDHGGWKKDDDHGGWKKDDDHGGWKKDDDHGGWKKDDDHGGWKRDDDHGGWKRDDDHGGWD